MFPLSAELSEEHAESTAVPGREHRLKPTPCEMGEAGS